MSTTIPSVCPDSGGVAGKSAMNLIQYVNGPPFLTALDPEVRVKGSRDPLGLELIWTGLGRTLVGNLTTITRSVRQFTTLLLGYYFAGQAQAGEGEDDSFLSAFLRFEQLAAYSRYKHFKEARSDIRGIRAVSRNISEGNGIKVPISVMSDGQILSNQQAYGVFGLFRVAARNSGLLDSVREDRLSPAAMDFVERQVGCLPNRLRQQITRLIADDRPLNLEGEHKELLKALSRLLNPKLSAEEIEFYGNYLVRGRYLTEPLLAERQTRLWSIVESVNSHPVDSHRWDREFVMPELIACISEARRCGEEDLAATLDRVRRCEELLGLASQIFSYLMGQNGQSLSDVARSIQSVWSVSPAWLQVSDLRDVFGRGGETAVSCFLYLADALRTGDYEWACNLLVQQNDNVMQDRGGGPWIVLEDGKVRINYNENSRDLPLESELKVPWVHTYFLNALKSIGAQVYHDMVGRGEDAEE